MTLEDFLRDCEGLTETSGLVGRCAANTAAVLSRLDKAEAAALCQTLVDLGAIAQTQRRDLADCLERLRRRLLTGRTPKTVRTKRPRTPLTTTSCSGRANHLADAASEDNPPPAVGEPIVE